jgi:hypothetical protein
MVEDDKSVALAAEMKPDDPEQIEKRKLFLKLLTDEYRSEQRRSNVLDEKAFKSLSTTAVILAFVGLFLKLGPNESISATIRQDPILSILLTLFALSLVAAWILSFRTVHLISYRKLSLKNEEIYDLDEKTLSRLYAGFSASYFDLNVELENALKTKVCYLHHAHWALFLSGMFGFSVVAWLLIRPT